jgi:hypothetical protein
MSDDSTGELGHAAYYPLQEEGSAFSLMSRLPPA